MKYDYTIAKTADENIYRRQCGALEKAWEKRSIPFKKTDLVDVDGSITTTYDTGGDTVIVNLDFYVDATYLESTTQLDTLLVR